MDEEDFLSTSGLELEPDLDSDSDRPPPHASALLTEHCFPVIDSANDDWASLTVHSRAAEPTHRPGYLTTDTVNGIVRVNLPASKEQRFEKVVVSVSSVLKYQLSHLLIRSNLFKSVDWLDAVQRCDCMEKSDNGTKKRRGQRLGHKRRRIRNSIHGRQRYTLAKR